MKVKDLIKELQRVENQDHFIHLLGNHTNGEDEDFDIFFNNIEVWNDGNGGGTYIAMHHPYTKPYNHMTEEEIENLIDQYEEIENN
jgi:hypothetical protein